MVIDPEQPLPDIPGIDIGIPEFPEPAELVGAVTELEMVGALIGTGDKTAAQDPPVRLRIELVTDVEYLPLAVKLEDKGQKEQADWLFVYWP